jgi:hypothetical protein
MVSSYCFCIISLAYLMHCIILLLAHLCSYMLDHVQPKLEELTEQSKPKTLLTYVWIKASLDAFNQ